MSASRRTFLKSVIVSVGTAWAELRSNATASDGSAAAGLLSGNNSQLRPGAAPQTDASNYTRGVGVYPGDPREDFSPTLVEDLSTYRNLALLRPAYHSSSYDYNLTAQLVTDGIKHTHLPRWVRTAASFRGQLRKTSANSSWIITRRASSSCGGRAPTSRSNWEADEAFRRLIALTCVPS